MFIYKLLQLKLGQHNNYITAAKYIKLTPKNKQHPQKACEVVEYPQEIMEVSIFYVR